MAYIEWDYTVITSMVEKQGWDLPERESEEWNKFIDELGEKMRSVGLIFEKYCKFTPDVGEGVHLLDVINIFKPLMYPLINGLLTYKIM